MTGTEKILRARFPYTPTEGQKEFFQFFDTFLKIKPEERPIFLLKGYAGTGKTTIVSALVKASSFFNMKTLLLAPTGRAAKVMNAYTGKSAYTIHKKIYKHKFDEEGAGKFTRQKNYHKNTLFIVDEVSMISDKASFGSKSLLQDLIQFVFQNSDNKLIFIGDPAQLPPVGQDDSPALDSVYLKNNFQATLIEVELKEVLRQDADSGILKNATDLRNILDEKTFQPKFQTSDFADIFRMTGERLEDGLRYSYDKFGPEETVIVCRSNRAAVQYNEYIRRQMFFYENEIEAGDLLMVVKNNYFYKPDDDQSEFLANGDFVEVMKIVNFEELYGFRFATLMLRMPDFPDSGSFEAKVILDTLHTHTPALSEEQGRKLYNEVLQEIMAVERKANVKRALKVNPYANALQIKFAYALTCHKSQGGQWKAVFVDQGYIKEDSIDKDYVRWLYTALTRASKELFLLNFHKRFFGTS